MFQYKLKLSATKRFYINKRIESVDLWEALKKSRVKEQAEDKSGDTQLLSSSSVT